jgi:hypothetical protein
MPGDADSRAQIGYLFAAAKRGEVPEKVARDKARGVHMKDLPRHKRRNRRSSKR